jgi:hypothetical protein
LFGYSLLVINLAASVVFFEQLIERGNSLFYDVFVCNGDVEFEKLVFSFLSISESPNTLFVLKTLLKIIGWITETEETKFDKVFYGESVIVFHD